MPANHASVASRIGGIHPELDTQPCSRGEAQVRSAYEHAVIDPIEAQSGADLADVEAQAALSRALNARNIIHGIATGLPPGDETARRAIVADHADPHFDRVAQHV